MKNFIKQLFSKRPLPVYKPVLSRYVSFNTREILYESSCGKRYLKRVFRGFDEPFPIQTTHFLTAADMQKALKHGADSLTLF